MLRKWLRRWLNEESKYGDIHEVVAGPVPSNRPSREGLSFTLYPAVGGHVLETRCYDQKTDRHIGTLYMIDGEGDFADQVAKSITLEMMKQ
jgi:hypothetical protein